MNMQKISIGPTAYLLISRRQPIELIISNLLNPLNLLLVYIRAHARAYLFFFSKFSRFSRLVAFITIA